ncbi:N-acetylglutamate synthase, CG3035 family [Gordonia sp. NPDC003424]
MTEPFAGDRVVVRYRLGAATPSDWRPTPNPGTRGPSLSDVTGILVDDGDPLMIDRDGTPASIPRSEIVSIRLLSRLTVRNTEIRNLEAAAAAAWPGLVSTMIDGWLVRAGGGFTRRANSAVPVEFGARADGSTLEAIRDWYTERGLPTLLALPDRLLPVGQVDGRPASGDIHVLVADVPDLRIPDPSEVVGVDARPGAAWLRAYRGPDIDVAVAADVVAASHGPVAAASVGNDDRPVAIGRASVTEAPDGIRWLGVTALWTAPDERRRGLASSVLAALVGWGAARGADRCYVQVEADNRMAGTWYRRLGFGLHHTSRYVEI